MRSLRISGPDGPDGGDAPEGERHRRVLPHEATPLLHPWACANLSPPQPLATIFVPKVSSHDVPYFLRDFSAPPTPRVATMPSPQDKQHIGQGEATGPWSGSTGFLGTREETESAGDRFRARWNKEVSRGGEGMGEGPGSSFPIRRPCGRTRGARTFRNGSS